MPLNGSPSFLAPLPACVGPVLMHESVPYRIDDDIYEHFRRVFPTFDIAAVTEASLKSPEAKELWRPFCDAYSKRLNDHNVGSLLRADPTKGFEEENTILGTQKRLFKSQNF
mgnify:FL=1